MRTQLTALAVAATIVLLSSNAEGQVWDAGKPVWATDVVNVSPPVVPWGHYAATYAYAEPFVPAYSYYAAPFPYPARVYVPVVGNDFPFYGRPYGHAYDPWTWPYVGRSPNTWGAAYYVSLPWR